MSNPVISRNPYFDEKRAQRNTPAGYPTMPGYDEPGASAAQGYNPNFGGAGYPDQQQYGQQQYQQQQYGQQQYGYPQADPRGPMAGPREGTMTYEDAMMKTGILLGITILSAAAAWMFLVPTAAEATSENMALPLVVAVVASLIAFGIGIFMAFKRQIGPGLAIAYSAIEGVCLGALTGVLEVYYPGIAVQAILATFAVVAVTWVLHSTGLVRTTAKGMKIMITIALAGIIFTFANLILTWTGVFDQPWGMRSVEVMGMPLGLILGVVMIIVAAYFLINDFETVKIAVANNAPKSFAWTAAVGIVMTVLWIYLEVLRLIAILREN